MMPILIRNFKKLITKINEEMLWCYYYINIHNKHQQTQQVHATTSEHANHSIANSINSSNLDEILQ